MKKYITPNTESILVSGSGVVCMTSPNDGKGMVSTTPDPGTDSNKKVF